MDKHREWLNDIRPYIPDIESICLNSGLEETIPDFIYDEMCEKSKKQNKKYQQFIIIDAANLKLYPNNG